MLGPYVALTGAYRQVSVGDLDGDGLDDMVASGQAVTREFRQLPDGTFEHLQWNAPQGDLRFADLDGDGDLDALRLGFGLDVFDHDGRGGFSRSPYRSPPSCCQFLWDLSVADLDGDGDLDVIFSGRTNAAGALENGVHVLWNTTRHLRLAGLIAVGGALEASVQSALGPADPSRVALATIGFGRGSLRVPGVGEIRIDLNRAVSMPWAPFGGLDTAQTSVSIPLVPTLIGVELFVQGATLGAAAAPELTHVAVGRVHG